MREVFEQVLEIEPDGRARFLDGACEGDAALRREVESLLAADDRAGTSFLEGNALDAAPAGPKAENESLAGKRIGPYQVIEEIGHGGMGSVYRALRADDQYQKQVAIKLMRGGTLDAFSLRRFKAERQILADLDHPNIARLLDGGATEDNQPYVVMELVQGRPIDDYCEAKQLSLRERIELFRGVCSAVAYAHQRLVVHRDLKPANILVTDTGEAKLLDFGIAKIVGPDQADHGEQTVTLIRAMTPEYASPEQVRGEPISTASDVYSLGVVLYGLVTGKRPYRTTSQLPHEVAQAVVDQEPERPSLAAPPKWRRALRGDLDNIVLKALRKEPERRYASVEQLSEDLRHYLSGLPVMARPATFLYRAEKFVRRNKAATIAAALFVLSLVGGMAATLVQASIARAERARAEQRFNDVRQLANSLLFEVHDAIQNLPGSTPARKILVDRALEYLDKLAREASGDRSLESELAAAYEKVGDVQGGFRSANLGDIGGFISSYRKALAIRERVAAAEPGNLAAQRELLRARGRLSDALLNAGDLNGALDQLKQVLAVAEHLASADPKNLADRRNLALAHLDYGWKRAGAGDWQAGLDECRSAASMLEVLVRENPNDRGTARVLAVAYGRVGEMLSARAAKHDEALALYRKALGIEQVLLQADPENADLHRMEAWEMLRTGEELAAMGDAGEALKRYERTLAEAQGLSKADPDNVQSHFDVAAAWSRIGTLNVTRGRPALARSNFERSLAELEPFAKPGAATADARELMATDQAQLEKLRRIEISRR